MTNEGQDQVSPIVTFSYLKSEAFRVIKADGALGGLTPRGDIVMSIFNERLSLPDQQEFEVSEDGKLTFLKEETTHKGIVREIEVAISLRPETALLVANWLQTKVKEFEQHTGIKLNLNDSGAVDVTNEKTSSDTKGKGSSNE